jgi:hypothetical protein
LARTDREELVVLTNIIIEHLDLFMRMFSISVANGSNDFFRALEMNLPRDPMASVRGNPGIDPSHKFTAVSDAALVSSGFGVQCPEDWKTWQSAGLLEAD